MSAAFLVFDLIGRNAGLEDDGGAGIRAHEIVLLGVTVKKRWVRIGSTQRVDPGDDRFDASLQLLREISPNRPPIGPWVLPGAARGSPSSFHRLPDRFAAAPFPGVGRVASFTCRGWWLYGNENRSRGRGLSLDVCLLPPDV